MPETGSGGGAGGNLPTLLEHNDSSGVDDGWRLLDGESGSTTRVGLMGVDVPLPTEGRVYWFVGARAGSSLTFDASSSGTSGWLRALLFLALTGAFSSGILRLVRRTRAARTAARGGA